MNSKESIFAVHEPTLCSCIQQGSRVMQNSSIFRAKQTTLVSCLLFFGFRFGLFAYALQMHACSTLPKFGRYSTVYLYLHSISIQYTCMHAILYIIVHNCILKYLKKIKASAGSMDLILK